MVIAISAILLVGCTTRMQHIPKLNIAGKSIQGSTFSVSDYTMVEPEVKSDDAFSILLFPFLPLAGNNQKLVYGMIDNAVKKVCEENNYDFMTNVKVYFNMWGIPYLYGRVKVTIVGEGWTKKASGELQDELLQLGFSLDDNGGKI